MKKTVFTLSILVISLISLLVFIFIKSSQTDLKSDISLKDQEESGPFLKVSKSILVEDITAASGKSRNKSKSESVNIGSIPIVPVPTTNNSVTEFRDSFSNQEIIEETSNMGISTSLKWWVNSGGRFSIVANLGNTILGNLSSTDRWFKEYSYSNPVDTDGGLHPQNIFRLVQKDSWQNFSQEIYFRIKNINQSQSPNRNASNGVLLFNRYQSGDNLYYAGVRVDGALVIKKKYQGTYYTMGYKKIFSGTYDPISSPNILPTNVWVGIKTEITNQSDGSVSVKLFIDKDNSGVWVQELSAVDRNGLNGASVISSAGYAGIRTDFMDVNFDNYLIKSI